MTKVKCRAEIFPDDGCFVGFCRKLDVSSFGDTVEDAGRSLQEAVELFLEGCKELGTLDDILSESGFGKFGDTWILRERATQDRVAIVPSPLMGEG